MHSIRDLRRRIRSISSTAQITKAMQMVAASKMRKAQQAALAGRPFAYLLYRIQREATTRMGEFSHPLLDKREVHKRAVILIAADKGLCERSTTICSVWLPSLIPNQRFSSQRGAKPRNLSRAPTGNLSPS